MGAFGIIFTTPKKSSFYIPKNLLAQMQHKWQKLLKNKQLSEETVVKDAT